MRKLLLVKMGENIKYFREKICNITQAGLAEKLDLSVKAISQIENGESDISITRLAQIAAALDTNIHHLLSELESPKSIMNNFYNQNGNQGVNIMHQNQLDEYQKLYEKIIDSKNEQIELLKRLIKIDSLD